VAEEAWQVGEGAVSRRTVLALVMKQSRSSAIIRRDLGDQIFRQVEIQLVGPHRFSDTT
jgi:hypothetical protein